MLNEATEVTDFLVPYGVLQRANVADVIAVAERLTPVPLHPFSAFSRGPELLSVEPQSTTRAFDERYPDGADYVVVPAMMPRDNQFVVDWIVAQHRKGAKIFSVCAGSLTLAAADLLDGRRATTHWAYIRELQKAHPTMQWSRTAAMWRQRHQHIDRNHCDVAVTVALWKQLPPARADGS